MKRNSLATLSWGKEAKKEDYLGVRKMIATKEIYKAGCRGECFGRKLYRDGVICAETD